jgi:hypothetical protein
MFAPGPELDPELIMEPGKRRARAGSETATPDRARLSIRELAPHSRHAKNNLQVSSRLDFGFDSRLNTELGQRLRCCTAGRSGSAGEEFGLRALYDGAKTMPEYRAYILGIDGHRFVRVADFSSDYSDDGTALDAAKKLIDGHDVEVWDRGRLVARLDHTDGNPISDFPTLAEMPKLMDESIVPAIKVESKELA